MEYLTFFKMSGILIGCVILIVVLGYFDEKISSSTILEFFTAMFGFLVFVTMVVSFIYAASFIFFGPVIIYNILLFLLLVSICYFILMCSSALDEFESWKETNPDAGFEEFLAILRQMAPRIHLTPHPHFSYWSTGLSLTKKGWGRSCRKCNRTLLLAEVEDKPF